MGTQTVVEAALLSIEEAARVLRISRSRAYELAQGGELPGLVRIGRSLRVSRRALDGWIDQQAEASFGAHV